MIKPIQAICLSALVLLSCKEEPVRHKEFLYAGTYSLRNSQGIYVFEFSRDSVQFTLKQVIPEVANPSFLEIHPSGKFLYALSNNTDPEGNRVDLLKAFTIHPQNGTLELINQVPAHGEGACHVHLDKSGRYVYMSFYRSGSLAVFNINTDGSIRDSIQTIKYQGNSINPSRQGAPHVHSSMVSPDNQYLYVADLGTDKVMIYSIESTSGKLLPAISPWVSALPGSGPRHLTFHPANAFLYLAEEISSSTSLFYQDPVNGKLTYIQTISTLPEDFKDPNTVADIHTDPDGKFLYVSNRGHNSLAIYSINEDNGFLSVVGHQATMGEHPRNFLIEPEGTFLLVANRDTDNVVVFERDDTSGLLSYTGTSLSIPAPVCLKWLKL